MEGAVEVADTRQKLIRSRIEMMRGYAETTDCRRRFLLGYFGEPLPEHCDTCAAGSSTDVQSESEDSPSSQRWVPGDTRPGGLGATVRRAGR